jgi:hypothetical protein
MLDLNFVYRLNALESSAHPSRMPGFNKRVLSIFDSFLQCLRTFQFVEVFTRTYKIMAVGGLILLNLQAYSQTGKQGAGSISGTNVDVNNRTDLTANASAGTSVLTVTNSALNGGVFSSSLASGDLVMIIQMQGASINTSNSSSFGQVTNYNSAGRYELRCVASVPNSTTINVTVPLSNSYSAAGNVQIVRVPRYTSFNLSSGNSIAPPAWNGTTGGITVIEIRNNATINGSINATGKGFRGGAFENQTQAASIITTSWFSNDDRDGGNKGESIVGSETDYDAQGYRYGRGAIANGGGGGNSHNAGGGGGANGGVTTSWNGLGNPNNSGLNYSTAWNLEGGSFSSNTSSGGGRGGYTYGSTDQNAMSTATGVAAWGGNNRQNVGGYGGRPMDYSSSRMFFGGGGGAGDGNNNAASGGANGGGIIMIICYGNMSGSGTFVSSGATAANTSASHNDAPGGGGGGGTIILSATGTISNLYQLTANGGNGGNQLITNNESEGPGGGGGGGYIAISSGSPTRSVAAGSNGTTSSSALLEFLPNGATSGGSGTSTSFAPATIIGSLTANAGPDDNFCRSRNLNATLNANTSGTWSVASGTGGSFANVNNPATLFSGDSSQSYTIVWTVVNNLCQQVLDTMRLNPICQPLPVKMVNFTGELINDEVILDWVTASEENLDYFVVEKSYDQQQWQDLATIYTQGNSHTLRYYRASDNNPFGRLIYYRIRQVYHDFSFDYSKTIDVTTLAKKGEYILYPVPVSNTLTVQGNHANGSIKVMIYNHLGREMGILPQTSGETSVLDLTLLSNGVYLVKIFKDNEIIYTQMISKI